MTENNSEKSFWLKGSIELDPVLEEAAVDFLLGVMGAGIEQSVDGSGPDLLINAFFEEKNPDLTARQELQNKVEGHLAELAALFRVKQPQISWGTLEDQDWSSNWKIHFKPFVITEGLVISPTWEEYQAKEGERVIIMDPGMAFGTGHHATTGLSLALIRKILTDAEAQNVLDVGTGTGILGMGAALFGAERVVGIDNDPEAVRVARENVSLNGLDVVMAVSLTPLQELEEEFDLIVANIIHDVLLTMGDDLYRLSKKGGYLILSGILAGEQESSIIHFFKKTGFALVESVQEEEWVALRFKKNSDIEE